jgi:UDP-glucose 4-epimerase
MRVLVCGGAGYVGSHACVDLAEAGCSVVVLDTHVTSAPRAIGRLGRLTGRPVRAFRTDVRERDEVARILVGEGIDAVMHFAALKSPSESYGRSSEYFDVNVGGTRALLGAMADAGVDRLVFSSSATVYGEPDASPVREDAAMRPNNPYAESKVAAERLIADEVARRPGFGAAVLRYFNPAGAHPSGLIGEAPVGPIGNLFPYIAAVAGGTREFVRVFGGDWPTADGTGVRDYVHVMDLARAHRLALERLRETGGSFTVNLGAGRGVSVLEAVAAFAAVSGRPIPFRIVDRRPGDLGELLADPALADELLGWRAERDLATICRDAWAWQSRGASSDD